MTYFLDDIAVILIQLTNIFPFFFFIIFFYLNHTALNVSPQCAISSHRPNSEESLSSGFVYRVNKPRLPHLKTVVEGVEKLDFVCWSILSEYEGTGNEKDRKLSNSIYVRESISCSSKIELPLLLCWSFPKNMYLVWIKRNVSLTCQFLGNLSQMRVV